MSPQMLAYNWLLSICTLMHHSLQIILRYSRLLTLKTPTSWNAILYDEQSTITKGEVLLAREPSQSTDQSIMQTT